MTSPSTVPSATPADARQAVRSAPTGAAAAVIEVADLLVSELVTNAIVHGSGEATLVVEMTRGYIHVEVLDSDSTLTLAPLRVGPSSPHGRGLAIVDTLATAWGVEPRYVGRAVWFDLVV